VLNLGIKRFYFKKFKSWGDNEDLENERLLEKALTLMVINSNGRHYPYDLARVGFSQIKFNNVGVYYRLIAPDTKDVWSAELNIKRNEDDLICPVRALEVYYQRRSRYSKTVNKLFVKEDGTLIESDEMVERVKRVLEESNLEKKYIDSIIAPTAIVHEYEGVKIGRLGRFLSSKYNKPEALDMYIQQENLDPELLLFIDDNSDNVMKMFFENVDKTNRKLISCWYQPPKDGKDEDFDETYRAMLESFSSLNI